jgi:hypothetical protein
MTLNDPLAGVYREAIVYPRGHPSVLIRKASMPDLKSESFGYFFGSADLVIKNHRKKAPIANMMPMPIAE